MQFNVKNLGSMPSTRRKQGRKRGREEEREEQGEGGMERKMREWGEGGAEKRNKVGSADPRNKDKKVVKFQNTSDFLVII